MKHILMALFICCFPCFAWSAEIQSETKGNRRQKEHAETGETAFQKGQRYFYQKKFEMAEVMLSEALKENPENAAAYSYLGDLFLAKKRYEDSLGAYIKALELKPENAENNFRIAQVYYYMKNGTFAIEHFKKAYELDASMSFSLYHIGLTYLMVNRDKEGAIKSWEEYIAIAPNDPQRENINQVIELLKDPNFVIPSESSGISVEEALNQREKGGNINIKADKYEGLYENEEL